MAKQPTQTPKHQSGAALVVSLLFLLILTIIGITGMQVTSLEEKMAGNSRDRGLSFQAAEAALRFAENLLRTQGASLVYNCGTTANDSNPGLYLETSAACDAPAVLLEHTDSGSPWASDYRPDYQGTLANIKEKPRYLIQQLPAINPNLEAGVPVGSGYFRITSRGVGGTTTAVTILQSTFKP